MLEVFAHAQTIDSVDNNDFWGHMTSGHYINGSDYNFVWMTLFMVVVALAVSGVVFYFLRSNDKKMAPLDEAKRRYAKGEISKKEYLDIKKTIKKLKD